MKLLNILGILTAAIMLWGCGTAGVLQPGAMPPALDESIVVIGVKSPGFKVQIFPVHVNGDEFRPDAFGNAVVNGSPTDGYLVAKVKGGQTLGVNRVIAPKGESFVGDAFSPCKGNRGLIFEVPRGGLVVYITDVEYVRYSNRLEVRYSNELNRAKKYVKEKFPTLTTDINKLEIRLLNSTSPCERDIVIPIFIRK